nr:exonuclease [uncultured phage]CAI9752210.1 exonuclease [uncultured phage]
MIIFNKISIISFKSIFKAELDFDSLSNNFYSLEGINNTVEFASSNGSGKSSLADALSFALYGTTMGIYLKKDEYQNKFSNLPLKLILWFTVIKQNNELHCKLERTLDNVKLFIDDVDVSELTKTETENKLLSLIDITKEEFFSFTYLTQTSGGNFLNKTASEKLTVIKNFIFGEDITKIKINIDNLLKTTKKQLTDQNNKLAKLEGILTGLEKASSVSFEDDSVTEETLVNHKKELSTLQKQLHDRLAAETENKQLELRLQQLKQQMQQLKQQMQQIKNNICPLCEQHLIDDTAEQQLRGQAKTIKQEADKIKLCIVDCTTKLSAIPEIRQSDIQQLQNIINKETIFLEQKSKQDTIVNEFKTTTESIAVLEQEILNTTDKVTQLTDLQKYFNNTFIQNLQQAFVKEIENYLNLYCSDVFDDSFSLVFNNNSLDLFVGEHPYSYFSGGERQRIDLLFVFAIKIALTNFTDKCTNLLILDESLSGSDTKAFDNTVELIDRLSSASGLTTILVSHKDNGYAKNKIVIERNNDNTKLSITQ